MSFNRRNFLLKFGLASFLAGNAKAIGLNPSSPNLTTGKKLENSDFPYVSSVKFFFPNSKSQEEVLSDIKSWCHPHKFANVTNTLIANNLMSSKKDRVIEKDHVEFRLYFSSKASCDTYKELMSKNSVVHVEKQTQLGYKVLCNYYYS